MTDTPSTPEMPEMVPNWQERAKGIREKRLGYSRWLDGVQEVIETAFRDGWDARGLAERSVTPEPNVSALERARKLLMEAPYDRSHADGEWLETAIAAAITEAETAAIASVTSDVAAIRREALQWVTRLVTQHLQIKAATLVGKPHREDVCRALAELNKEVRAQIIADHPSPVQPDRFKRLAEEPPPILPEGYAAPLDIRTTREVVNERVAAQPDGWRSDIEAAPNIEGKR